MASKELIPISSRSVSGATNHQDKRYYFFPDRGECGCFVGGGVRGILGFTARNDVYSLLY